MQDSDERGQAGVYRADAEEINLTTLAPGDLARNPLLFPSRDLWSAPSPPAAVLRHRPSACLQGSPRRCSARRSCRLSFRVRRMSAAKSRKEASVLQHVGTVPPMDWKARYSPNPGAVLLFKTGRPLRPRVIPCVHFICAMMDTEGQLPDVKVNRRLPDARYPCRASLSRRNQMDRCGRRKRGKKRPSSEEVASSRGRAASESGFPKHHAQRAPARTLAITSSATRTAHAIIHSTFSPPLAARSAKFLRPTEPFRSGGLLVRLPACIGIERRHRAGNCGGVGAERLFVDHAVLVDDKRHHA